MKLKSECYISISQDKNEAVLYRLIDKHTNRTVNIIESQTINKDTDDKKLVEFLNKAVDLQYDIFSSSSEESLLVIGEVRMDTPAMVIYENREPINLAYSRGGYLRLNIHLGKEETTNVRRVN